MSNGVTKSPSQLADVVARHCEARDREQQARIIEVATKPKPEVIHRTQLFGGRETAHDVHRQLAWTGARCQGCRTSDVVVRISCAMSPKDLLDRAPNVAIAIIAESESGQIPSFESKYGPLTRFSEIYACAGCQADAERAAAHLPSHVYVEIDRGPGRDKIVVQVPAGARLDS